MLKNYLLSAIRNIKRNKLSSGISIFGLAIGITSAFLMFRYVQFELSYDAHHQDGERIYRLSTLLTGKDRNEKIAPTAMVVAPELKRLLKEVEEVGRVVPVDAVLNLNGTQAIRQEKFFQVDASITNIFIFHWLAGRAKEAFSSSYSIVLAASTAKKLFGEQVWMQDLIGKQLLINQKIYTISGIIQDMPLNTDWKFDALLSLDENQYEWYDFNAFTYLKTKEAVSYVDLNEGLKSLDQYWYSPLLQKEWGTEDTYAYHQAVPIQDLHFTHQLMGDMPGKGNMNLIIVLSLIAVFLLLIASINFINLFIAQSIKRNKEVGIRKVVGARKVQLIGQYLSESVIFAFVSSAIAIIVIQLIEPFWVSYTGISLKINHVFDENIFLYLSITLILVGIFAGSYAAFFLASSNPIRALKSDFRFASPRTFHKFLQLLQFSIATGMVLSTLIVHQQLDYLLHTQLGYDQQQLMVLNVPEMQEKKQRLARFKQYIKDKGYAQDVALGGKPGDLYLRGTVIQEMEGMTEEVPVNALYADEDYLRVLGVTILEGNNFNENDCACEYQYLVNETLAKRLNWADVVGKNLDFEGEGKIVGVMKDFHYQSLHYAIEPLIIILKPEASAHLLVRADMKYVDGIEAAWQTFFPNAPINYSFLEREIAQQYSTEKHMIDLFTFFSILTILISCMGLFGMSALNLQLRTKAMGIHKIMGANRLYIFYLLSKESMLTVCYAIIIALPLSGFVMLRWLNHFEYHTPFDWLQLLLAGSIVLLLALLTSCYHGIQICRLNPVLSLRNE
ncbi:ABC transporter permease [Porifericola rhodea]|uniref:ABC transporter permease n=1 Tax=Porifericola rhodea TaxID=930972 RepID=UPI0026661171|nr:ABC transporter permease [Porifericola rhodea]WKN31030.1 ABC transporter permease [Porifericola rhodea]